MTRTRNKKNRTTNLLTCVVVALLIAGRPAAASAAEAINIATESWDKYTNLDGSGLFLDIARAVFEPHGVELRVEYVPYKRALYLLEFRKADAMYGTYAANKEGKSYLLTPRLPIDREQTVAIFDKSKNDWRGQQSLSGRALAWVGGYDYHESLDANVRDFTEVRDTQQGLKMLRNGRIDYFLDHAGSLSDAIESSGFDTGNYRIETVIEENIYMAFANTDKGQKLAGIYDLGISRLIESGELRKIFTRYELKYPFAGGK